VSLRIDKSWTVLASRENAEGTRCVDLFARPDGTFGFEEFRRDPEDRGLWTPVAHYSRLSYDAREAALAEARRGVPWLVRAEARSGRGDHA
jgi:hypothetical protein